jgi:hypothetical protein
MKTIFLLRLAVADLSRTVRTRVNRPWDHHPERDPLISATIWVRCLGYIPFFRPRHCNGTAHRHTEIYHLMEGN